MPVKRKLFMVLFLSTVILTVSVLYFYRPYRLPSGYQDAPRVWQQLGLTSASDRVPDGSASYPYDVIVWGSDPEGIAAAVSAARNGLNTLLLDYRNRVGGLFILGELNFLDLSEDHRGKLVTKGIFEEFYRKVGGTVFDLEKGEQVFQEMLSTEPLLTTKLNRSLIQPLPAVEENRLAGIKVKDPSGREEKYYGKIIIDASQDANLAEMAGVPFTRGLEDIGLPGKTQAATLVFHLKGVHWPTVMWETLVKDKRSSSKATFRAAWGYDQYINEYQPQNPAVSFRGFNMARQSNGDVLINGLLIYGVNGPDPRSKTEARKAAQEEAYRFMEFAREKLPGFQNATISGFAEELYIRESNHMVGLYRLTIDDVLENRDFPDRIGYGGYPVDIQAVDSHTPGIVVGAGDKYAIPLRCLVPPNYQNLLVVGRSASYDSLAHGSTRIVGVGMVAGQAAGVVSAYSLATGKNFQEIPYNLEDMQFIQQVLASQGALVAPSHSRLPEETHHVNYEALKKLRSLGVVIGGYQNEYALDEPLPIQSFLNILFHATVRTLNIEKEPQLARQSYYVVYPETGNITVSNITEVLNYFVKFNPHLPPVLNNRQFTGYIADFSNLDKEEEIPRGELYELIVRYLSILKLLIKT